MKFIINKTIILLLLFIIFAIAGCSTAQTDENNEVNINDITVTKAFNRTPKESSVQIDLELSGIVDNNDLNKDIDYEWSVEPLNYDINYNSLSNTNTSDISDDDTGFFLDISKNDPQKAMLSIYQNGYYKITFKFYNNNVIKDKSIIVKCGEPSLPFLFVKVNLPNEPLASENFNGNLYLEIEKNGIKSGILNLNAKELKNEWYNTDININPFSTFNIISGTHIIDINNPKISTINNAENDQDNIFYNINNTDNEVSTIPLLIKNIDSEKFTIYKTGNSLWKEGNIFISYLIWENGNKENTFVYFEDSLNPEKNKTSMKFENLLLSKIFIGSFGFKPLSTDYFVYFGPEGIDIDDLDPQNNREVPNFPYGYLIGKLGEEGNIFPIGNNFNYQNNNTVEILSF